MRVCVAALLVQSQHILLGKRAPNRAFYPDVWDVVGGHVEPGESHEQALQRELAEELGIVPRAWTHVDTVAEPHPERYGLGQYYFYVVTAWDGTPTNRQPHEHATIAWFSFEQAALLSLAHPSYGALFAQLAARQHPESKGES